MLFTYAIETISPIGIFSRTLCVPSQVVMWNCFQDLKDFMRQAGEVTYADAHKQRKNEGYV